MSDIYYPPPESQGGWRWLSHPDEIVTQAGMDPAKLDQVQQLQEFLHGSDSWGIAIIRHGYLVRECYTFTVWPTTRFDVWSCTKTFTGTAWGLLLDDSRHNRLPGRHNCLPGERQVILDTPVYDLIPEGHPLTDPRKARILIRHLLTMTSGIPGEASGVIGMPTTVDQGPFEHALGDGPNRYGKWVNELVAEPGTHWEYSDPAFVHLSLALEHVLGRPMRDYMQQRILDPIGIEQLSWDLQGGRGYLGPHTNAHSGVHVSARELARFGYLYLHRGVWDGEQLVPEWWVDLATQTSQEHNPAYGYTWWVNTQGARWPGLPRDAFALEGYRSNRCYIIPSLDLVVARVGSGPPTWNEGGLIGGIVSAILD